MNTFEHERLNSYQVAIKFVALENTVVEQNLTAGRALPLRMLTKMVKNITDSGTGTGTGTFQ